MAKINCDACDELRTLDPSMIVNGLGDDECTSLANDTGIVASSGHNDCTDLKMLNDCLVGNMIAELEKTDLCDWKEYMEKYATNDYTTNKAMICAICGIWENIHAIWECLLK